MDKKRLYFLPELPYSYKDLEPYMSEEQLKLHHQKHHQAYVNGANAIFEKFDNARKGGIDLDIKAVLKELSFHIAGHTLHSLFWPVLRKGQENNQPEGVLANKIEKEFGSFDRFKKEFSQAAISVEGSGWAVLTFDEKTGRLTIMQIEKHNNNVYPTFKILILLDVWEHSYYLDYKNDRVKFVENFWQIIDWNEANNRLKEILE